MAKVRWTEEASNWLENIYDYVAQDNVEIAARVTSEIFRKAESLERFPRRGHLYRRETEGEIRILHYGHYRIVYLIRDEESIDLLGIFHGALDIEQYL